MPKRKKPLKARLQKFRRKLAGAGLALAVIKSALGAGASLAVKQINSKFI